MATSFMQFMSTDAGQSRMMMNDLFTEKQSNPEYFTISADGTATPTIKAWTEIMETISPKAPSFAPLTYAMSVEGRNLQLTNLVGTAQTSARDQASDQVNVAKEWMADGDTPFKKWLTRNKIPFPDSDNPTEVQPLLEAYYIQQHPHYINTPQVRDSIDSMYPMLGGSSGGTRKYNPATGDFEN